MRSVAILGFGPTRDRAPAFGDPKWSFWGMAHDQEWHNFERVFELHERTLWERLHGKPEADHVRELNDMWQPLFMRYQYEDVPSALAYPMAEVAEALEPPQSSIAAIITWAPAAAAWDSTAAISPRPSPRPCASGASRTVCSMAWA